MNFKLYKFLVEKDNNASDYKIILYRSIAMMLLVTVTAYMVYYAPEGLDKIFCAILLVIFWYSKKDYFWFAFFLIIASHPSGLFTESTRIAVRRLPIYSPLANISFSVSDLFLIIAALKALVKGKRLNLIDVFNIKKIVIILPFVITTTFFFGVSLKMFLNQTIRGLFFYTLFFSFPALIYSKKDVLKFMTMFLPFVFLELFAQLYAVKTGSEFVNLLNPGAIVSIMDSFSGEIRSVPIGYLIMRLAFVFAFVLLERKEKLVPRFYLLLVILVSLSSVIVSATRSAITMFLFIFVFYFLIIAKRKPNLFLQIFIICVVFIMIMDITNIFDLNNIVGNSYNRFIGAVSIEQGSIKAEDTFDNRISNRLPALLDAINNSLYIGYGFSDKYFEVLDTHLGGVLVGLLQVGIFGYSLYIVFITNIFRKSFKYIRKLKDDNSYKSTIKVFTLSFFGYLIVNMTVDPIFVINTAMLPQDIFVHLVLATYFVNQGIREHLIKKMELKKLYAS